jgi:anthranilate/para-aminobenzoate synthase component II
MQKAKDYPFYSVQFHPEINVFNWIVDANKTA